MGRKRFTAEQIIGLSIFNAFHRSWDARYPEGRAGGCTLLAVKDHCRGGREDRPGKINATCDNRCEKTKFQKPVPLFGGEHIMDKKKDVSSKNDTACSIVCRRCGRCCRMANELLHGDATTRDIASRLSRLS